MVFETTTYHSILAVGSWHSLLKLPVFQKQRGRQIDLPPFGGKIASKKSYSKSQRTMKTPLFSFRKENIGKLKISKLTHFLLGDFRPRKTTLMLLDRQKKDCPRSPIHPHWHLMPQAHRRCWACGGGSAWFLEGC